MLLQSCCNVVYYKDVEIKYVDFNLIQLGVQKLYKNDAKSLTVYAVPAPKIAKHVSCFWGMLGCYSVLCQLAEQA